MSADHPQPGLHRRRTRSAACCPPTCCVRISEGKDVSRAPSPPTTASSASRSVRDDAERALGLPQAALARAARDACPAARETDDPDATRPAWPATDWLRRSSRELGFGALTAVGAAGHHRRRRQQDLPDQPPLAPRPVHLPPGTPTWTSARAARARCRRSRWSRNASTAPRPTCGGSLTNGRQLRLLRDSSALATASYVEFDLEAIFDGELFSEFVLLYRLLHVSRFEVPRARRRRPAGWRSGAPRPSTPAPAPSTSSATESSRRITALGTGFLAPPGQRRACARPRRRRPSTTPCCGWSTGCSSSSSPRTAALLLDPDARRAARERVREVLLHRPAARATPGAAGAPRTATCTRRCASSSTRSATRTAAPSSACPASAASSTTPTRTPPLRRPAAWPTRTC